jgi:hypothetical protein
MRASARALFLLVGLLTLAVLSGCTKTTIPNTDVEANDLNRRVIQFCEDYRHAVEHRNIALLLQMADPRYYEDGGNIDASDDLDYAGLKKYLEDEFRKTKAIRYEIRYREVGKGRNNTIYVDYTYSASYKIPTKDGDVWRRTVADNRLELVPSGESFKILSGM